MYLSDEILHGLSSVAVAAAKDAAEFIELKSNNLHSIKRKFAGSTMASQIVTEIDLESQRIILNHLKPTI